jgi:pyrroline-5-carboxylate reductase
MTRLGIIGTGHFASYFIAALRRGGYDGDIVLSPRNAEMAARIARDHRCRVAPSNADVLDQADIILLSVRPQHLGEVAARLTCGSRHTVLSALAGIQIDRLRGLFPGAGAIHRIMPSSYIETVRGPIPLYPEAPSLLPFLARAGDVVALPDEPAFEVAMIAACFSTWMYDLAGAVADELSRHGLDPANARALALGNMAGAAGFALTNPQDSLAAISAGIATEGTFTKAGLDHLKGRDFAASWREAIAMLSAKLQQEG